MLPQAMAGTTAPFNRWAVNAVVVGPCLGEGEGHLAAEPATAAGEEETLAGEGESIKKAHGMVGSGPANSGTCGLSTFKSRRVVRDDVSG